MKPFVFSTEVGIMERNIPSRMKLITAGRKTILMVIDGNGKLLRNDLGQKLRVEVSQHRDDQYSIWNGFLNAFFLLLMQCSKKSRNEFIEKLELYSNLQIADKIMEKSEKEKANLQKKHKHSCKNTILDQKAAEDTIQIPKSVLTGTKSKHIGRECIYGHHMPGNLHKVWRYNASGECSVCRYIRSQGKKPSEVGIKYML